MMRWRKKFNKSSQVQEERTSKDGGGQELDTLLSSDKGRVKKDVLQRDF